MIKNKSDKLVLFLSIGLLFLGGFLYYFEKNPRLYNVLASSGINLNILDSLGRWEEELECGTCFSLVDEKGRELDKIGRFVFIERMMSSQVTKG